MRYPLYFLQPSLIDHGQSRKSSYIIEGELDTIRCTTDLQRDAAEMSSIAIHGTHTKKEAPVVSIANGCVNGYMDLCYKSRSLISRDDLLRKRDHRL